MENCSMDMMAMKFNFEFPGSLLFNGWKVCSEGELIGSCVAVCLIAIGYEALKNLRIYWANKCNQQSNSHGEYSKAESVTLSDQSSRISLPTYWIINFGQSALHMLQIFTAYMLMLVTMTFNVWLVISIIFGAGLGHLLAGGINKKSKPEGSPEVIKTRVLSTDLKSPDTDAENESYTQSSMSSSSIENAVYDNDANFKQE